MSEDEMKIRKLILTHIKEDADMGETIKKARQMRESLEAIKRGKA